MTDRADSTADIQRLDDRTVERIAAGEVVERPASVVKELVENSLDADASRVSVAVEAGGTGGISVSDDGVGMSRDQVEKAVRQHTTSKLRDVEDLAAGVATLGFRGEALHAIGAVSRLTIRTRPRGERAGADDATDATAAGDAAAAADGSAAAGTELVLEGGTVTDAGPAGRPPGTTVEVADLFYNVPARRKYLEQPSTEFAHVNTVVTSYALANPDVAVSLEHGGRETFATSGQGDLRETVMAVYGREVANAMVDVDGSDLPDGPLDSVTGLVSHPETNRAGREYLSTYVNGRYVRAGTVREAVVDAYGTQLAPDRYPFAVLFLDVDPGTVDVNVHPRKMEVRFADEEGVRRQVHAAVERTLLDEGLVRSGAPRGRSAPEQTEIAPDAAAESTDREGDADAPDGGNGSTEPTTGAGTPSHVDADARGTTDATDATSAPRQGGGTETGTSSTEPAVRRSGEAADATASSESSALATDPDRKFRGGREQARLGDADPEAEFESLPAMRILGQLHDTYVVAETTDGLVLIDQHAADERINYERLKTAFEGETTTQALAEPVAVELTAREAEVFAARSEALARLGFRATATGDRTVEVSTVPGVVADADGPELVRDALSALVEGDAAAAETVEAAADELLGDLACYPSVTGNVSLAEGSIRDLLAALDDCENPYACPHGRPVVVELDRDEIEDRFERDYPGHAGRRE